MRRKWTGAPVAVGVLLSLAGISPAALAAHQVKGGSYKGSLQATALSISVSFKVSSNGKQVASLSTSNIPIYCSAGGRAIPVHFKSASISGGGTFTSTGQVIIKEGPLTGQLGETLKITGKFLKGKREQGTLTTTYPKAPASCSGKSAYTTKAS